SYLLLTSLFPEWNYFSAPLIINLFLIWIFYRMTNLYNTPKPVASIFNIGMILGVVTLLYQPAIVFVLLLLLALFIMRPFRVQEWLIGLLGISAPYYFLLLILYFRDVWDWRQMLPTISFRLPSMPSSIAVTVSIILLVVPFIIGGVFVQNNLNDICASIQYRIVSILLNKLEKAAIETGITRLCIAGGVSANSGLRNGLQQLADKKGWQAFIPKFEYCTDNAAMIAITAYYKHLAGESTSLNIPVTARAEW
ncbi:MAG: hypothetical protein EOO02_08680, partial [Chitinophagaceae bacterium]